MKKLPGVVSATATPETKEEVVVYDDAKTNIKQIINATTQAGYPSTVKGAKSK